MKYGDVIFVEIDFLESFLRKSHPHIDNPYVLITHNGDLPEPGKYRNLLEDPQILVWYAQNVSRGCHPKERGEVYKMFKFEPYC